MNSKGDGKGNNDADRNALPALRRLGPILTEGSIDLWSAAKKAISVAEASATRAEHAAIFARGGADVAADASVQASATIAIARRKIDELYFLTVASHICNNVRSSSSIDTGDKPKDKDDTDKATRPRKRKC